MNSLTRSRSGRTGLGQPQIGLTDDAGIGVIEIVICVGIRGGSTNFTREFDAGARFDIAVQRQVLGYGGAATRRNGADTVGISTAGNQVPADGGRHFSWEGSRDDHVLGIGRTRVVNRVGHGNGFTRSGRWGTADIQGQIGAAGDGRGGGVAGINHASRVGGAAGVSGVADISRDIGIDSGVERDGRAGTHGQSTNIAIQHTSGDTTSTLTARSGGTAQTSRDRIGDDHALGITGAIIGNRDFIFDGAAGGCGGGPIFDDF